MFANRWRAFRNEWLLRWLGGGDLPRATDDDDPRWYELPHWC